MNRQKLIALGVEEGLIEDILEVHNKTLDGNYVTKSRFNEVNEDNKKLKTQVEERDTQISSLSEVDADKLQETIAQLEQDNQDKEKEYQKELDKLKVKHSAERQILDYKARDLTSVLAHVDLSESGLNDDGTVQGLKDKLEALKEEKAFLFEEEPQEPEKPKFKGAQPGTQRKVDPNETVDLSKMTYKEQVEFKMKHPEKYQELTQK